MCWSYAVGYAVLDVTTILARQSVLLGPGHALVLLRLVFLAFWLDGEEPDASSVGRERDDEAGREAAFDLAERRECECGLVVGVLGAGSGRMTLGPGSSEGEVFSEVRRNECLWQRRSP